MYSTWTMRRTGFIRPARAGRAVLTDLADAKPGAPPYAARGGYTLLELMFVVFIIALMLSIAMPRLLPALLSSQLEGAARHLANYGRSAIAYSALNREPITVRIDLQKREYYSLKWMDEQIGLNDMKSAGLSGIEGKNSVGLSKIEGKKDAGLSVDPSNQMTIQDMIIEGDVESLEAQRDEVQLDLDMAFRRSLQAQAMNVPHETVRGDIDPIFKKDFKLTVDGEEEQRDEIADALLGHGYLPEEISIESVLLGGEQISEGTVDVEVTPIGLSQSVSFILKNTRDEYYTVQWDPITGGAHLARGKELANAEPGL